MARILVVVLVVVVVVVTGVKQSQLLVQRLGLEFDKIFKYVGPVRMFHGWKIS